jgi:hypothetical protein
LKPLESAIFIYVQHHVAVIFAKISEGTLKLKKLHGCLSAPVRKLTSIFYVL